jgi:hypothetical protein
MNEKESRWVRCAGKERKIKGNLWHAAWDEDGDEDKGELRQAWCRFAFLGKVDHSAKKNETASGYMNFHTTAITKGKKKQSMNAGGYTIVRAFNKCLCFSQPHNMSPSSHGSHPKYPVPRVDSPGS